VDEGSPSCSNRIAVYRCTVRDGILMRWRFTRQGEVTPVGAFDFHRLLSMEQEGEDFNLMVASVPVVFRITNTTSSFFSVTVTIPDPVPLNGVLVDCEGDLLEIIAPNEG